MGRQMTRFLDGPAAGKTLMLGRAPFFLRAVQAPDGTWDALDQLHDTPKPDERIVVYQLQGEPTRMHMQRVVNGRRACSWHEGGEYRLAADAPDDVTARDTAAWREWCYREGPKRTNQEFVKPEDI